MKQNIFVLMALAVLASGCRTNPVERLSDPVADGAVPKTSGVFTLYDDELKTGGGLAFIPLADNQSIDLQNHDAPRFSHAQIQYVWNGQPVNGQQLFAGFSLLITPDSSTLSATPARHFSTPGYVSLKLKVRGSLSAGNSFRIEGPSDGVSTAARTEILGSSISNTWQEVTLLVPSGDFATVKVFATFSIQYAQPPRTTAAGNGGTIFIDDVRYEN